ncbi:MAG: hypothetical protein VYC39_08895 [Myxococcota bacterium]|nr:hypothetical protein [Myxococcota bacterium]
MKRFNLLLASTLGLGLACGGDSDEQAGTKSVKKTDPLARTVTCKYTNRSFNFRCESLENCIPKNFAITCMEDFMTLVPQGERGVNNWEKNGHWNERKGKWTHFRLKVKKLKGSTIVASDRADIHLTTKGSHNVKARQMVNGFGIMDFYDEGFMTDTLKIKNVTLVTDREYQAALEYDKLTQAIKSHQNPNSARRSDSTARYAIDSAKRVMGETSPLYKAAFYLNKTTPEEMRRATATDSFNRDKFLLHALNFDLEAVMGLLEKGKIKDYSELEAKINDPSTGINNVDIDADRLVDWVAIEESRKDGKIHLSFVAYASSSPRDKNLRVVVAQVTLNKKAKSDPNSAAAEKEEIEIEGGYPEYAEGYDDYYYRQRYYVMTEAELARYMWLAERKAYERSWKEYQKIHKQQQARHLREMKSLRSSYRMKMGLAAVGAALITAKLIQSSRAKNFKMVSPRANPKVVAKAKSSHAKVRQVRARKEAAKVRRAERKARSARKARSVRSRGRSARSRGSRRGK